MTTYYLDHYDAWVTGKKLELVARGAMHADPRRHESAIARLVRLVKGA